jgi:hypothetical protein
MMGGSCWLLAAADAWAVDNNITYVEKPTTSEESGED